MSDAPVASGETAEAAAVPDRELLAAFVFRRDERAFERMVRRHGAMVYGVCRRVLRDAHACDDAFQATFLVLAKSAGRIRKRQSLASWLHGVAHRVARRALVERYRRHEQAAVMEQVIGEPELRDVEARHQQQLLDSELQALPERYREPLVLHYLEGLSNRELAERLGLSVAAVEGRLKRARKELRLRLTRHGVELSAIVVLLHAAQPAAAGALLESLITVAAKSGAAAAAGTLSTQVTTSQAAALAGKELAMLTFSTKFAAVMAVSIATVAMIGLSTGSATRANGGPETGGTPALNGVTEIEQLAQAGTAPRASDEGSPVSGAPQGSVDPNLPGAGGPPTGIGMTQPGPAAVAGPSGRAGDYHVRDATTQRIEDALRSETDVEFPANPLRDVIEYLSTAHDIPVLVDEAALSDQGISADEEVSLVISGVALENVLELILDNVAGVQLDYIVQNQVLKITTRERAEELLETRVYNVRDFGPEFDEVMLANVVRKSVQPRSWMNITIEKVEAAPGMEGSTGMMPGYSGGEAGGLYGSGGLGPDSSEITGMTIHADSDGNGTIDFLPGCLIITQSQRIHREIVSLLDQLRQHAANQPSDAGMLEPATYVDEFNTGAPYPGGSGVPGATSPGR